MDDWLVRSVWRGTWMVWCMLLEHLRQEYEQICSDACVGNRLTDPGCRTPAICNKKTAMPADFSFCLDIKRCLCYVLEADNCIWLPVPDDEFRIGLILHVIARKQDIIYVKKNIPQTVFRKFRDVGHGGLAVLHPEKFSKKLRALMSDRFKNG